MYINLFAPLIVISKVSYFLFNYPDEELRKEIPFLTIICSVALIKVVAQPLKFIL